MADSNKFSRITVAPEEDDIVIEAGAGTASPSPSRIEPQQELPLSYQDAGAPSVLLV